VHIYYIINVWRITAPATELLTKMLGRNTSAVAGAAETQNLQGDASELPLM
jgi:hypothetical protein